MMKNPYLSLPDKELAKIAEDVMQSKNDGVRAESLVPYAKEIFKNLNLNTNDPSVSLRECINMAYNDFAEEIMRRFVGKTQIFGNPRCGWCDFQLGDFDASLSYLTDVMYDTLAMCLDYLKTGGGTVQYDREDEGTFTLAITRDGVVILDENLLEKVRSVDIEPEEFCKQALDCYYRNSTAWINFANMGCTEEERAQYEKEETELFSALVSEIRKRLNNTSYWAEIKCDYFDEEEQAWIVDSWKTKKEGEESLAVAKIAKDGTVTYLDERAKTDAYVQDVIRERLRKE